MHIEEVFARHLTHNHRMQIVRVRTPEKRLSGECVLIQTVPPPYMSCDLHTHVSFITVIVVNKSYIIVIVSPSLLALGTCMYMELWSSISCTTWLTITRHLFLVYVIRRYPHP